MDRGTGHAIHVERDQDEKFDHILYSTKNKMKLLQTGRDWGPKNQNKDNVKSNGCLSDHPWVWCELEIPH